MSIAEQTVRRRDSLYCWIGTAAALIVFAGFARTYYLKEVFGAPQLSLLLHAHAMLVTLWFALFLIQARLVAIHRIELHRQLGVTTAVIAALVVLVGMEVAINASRRGFLTDPSSFRDIRGFAILCGFLLDFALLVGSALYFRRHPDTHKRLMLLAACSILAPAISRIPLDFIKTADLWVIFGLLDLLVLIGIGYDTTRNRKLHAAFGWGGLFVVGTFPATSLVAKSSGWVHLAKWLFT